MNKFNFDTVASEYDLFYETALGQQIDKLEKNLISKFLTRIENKIIVELGCGTGHWTSYFVQNGFSVIGIDISSQMLAHAVTKNIPNSIFINHDIHKLPFPNDSVANITAITTIEFVENQDKVFNEIYRILKPGGNLLIGCLNINSQIGKDKSENKIFRDADFFDYETLSAKLNRFGNPEISGSVYLNENNEFLDDKVDNKTLLKHGAFLAGFVRKEK